MTKYNNYAGIGSGDGAEPDRDPRPAREPDRPDLGPAGDEGGADDPRPDARPGQRRRRSGSGASTPPRSTRRRKSILVNSEDGNLYRWNLAGNTLTQRIQLTSGIGEAYTPTAIGADGAVYAINNAVLFAIAK